MTLIGQNPKPCPYTPSDLLFSSSCAFFTNIFEKKINRLFFRRLSLMNYAGQGHTMDNKSIPCPGKEFLHDATDELSDERRTPARQRFRVRRPQASSQRLLAV